MPNGRANSLECRTHWSITVLAVVSFVFGLNLLLYDLGVVDWQLRLGEPWAPENPVERYGGIAFFLVGPVFLLWFRRLRLRIDEFGVFYRGFVREFTLPWEDITRIRFYRGNPLVVVYTAARNLAITPFWDRQERIRELLVAMARVRSPNVVFRNLPQRYETQETDGDRDEAPSGERV